MYQKGPFLAKRAPKDLKVTLFCLIRKIELIFFFKFSAVLCDIQYFIVSRFSAEIEVVSAEHRDSTEQAISAETETETEISVAH